MSLTTVLQYSTIDYRFLETSLKQVSKFSDKIVIPICDHFFDGELEDQELLRKSFEIIKKYSNCEVYMFEWQGLKSTNIYYNVLSRQLGTTVSDSDWLLYIDVDEIVDEEFIDWFHTIKHTLNSYWLTCYWYFREPIYRAIQTEGAGLLIRKEYCNWNVNSPYDRQQLFGYPNFINGHVTPIVSKKGEPLVHHYSWVRTKEEMLKKVKNWGHKYDKNWNELIEEEFSRPFDGKDFVHGYSYNTVENKFNVG
jgi:hypothetical protein